MAKKNNVYSGLGFDVIKKELASTMEYLRSINIELIEDDIEFVATSTGGSMPSVVSSVEKKIRTRILIIFDFVSQLKVIHKLEGMTDFVVENIDAVREQLNEMQTFYIKRPPNKMTHRYHMIKRGVNKKTQKDIIVKVRSSTKEDQIKCRSDVQKKILEILPKLTELEQAKKEFLIKGGSELPPSLHGLV